MKRLFKELIYQIKSFLFVKYLSGTKTVNFLAIQKNGAEAPPFIKIKPEHFHYN